MQLLTPDIIEVARQAVGAYSARLGVRDLSQVDPRRLPPRLAADYSTAMDFAAAAYIAAQARTFLFDIEQIRAFLPALDRRIAPAAHPLPFPSMFVQFSRGLDERLFTSGLRVSGSIEQSDEVLGLLISEPAQGGTFVNVIAWYASTSINRVQLDAAGDGSIEYRPSDVLPSSDRQAMRRDKQRIATLGMLCLAYINSPGIEVERVAPDAAVNRRRVARGKRELPEYYVCVVRHERVAGSDGEAAAAGRHVSFRFDVRGHFRTLRDGRTVWVRPHQRGLEHERYKPKAYDVR